MGDTVLDYLGGLNVITRGLIRGRQEDQGQRRTCDDKSRGGNDTIAGRGACQRMQEAFKSWERQDIDSPLERPEGMQCY